jgi:hypothetical protein
MEAAVSATKRAIASSTKATISSRVRRVSHELPTVSDAARPKWIALYRMLQTAEESSAALTVPEVVRDTPWTAADLWKVVRKGQVIVECYAPGSNANVEGWTSAVTLFDLVRTYWQSVTCTVDTGYGPHTDIVWHVEDEPGLTVREMCARIEATVFGGEDAHTTDTTWCFLLQTGEGVTMNLTQSMATLWWSDPEVGSPTIGARANDVTQYTRPIALRVYPLDPSIFEDEELMEAMGILNNRVRSLGYGYHSQPNTADALGTPDVVDVEALYDAMDTDTVTNTDANAARQAETTALRAEQDAAFEASLAQDRAKQVEREARAAPAAVTESVGGAATVAVVADVEPRSPPVLTPAELRAARLRFYA